MADYTIKDVTKDLKDLLKLTFVFRADDDNFWQVKGSNERFVYDLGRDGNGKEVVNFQDPMPKGDFYYFNPFAEGFGKTNPITTYFYQVCRVGLNTAFQVALMHVAKAILQSKEAAAKGETYSISSAVVRTSSRTIQKRQTVYDVIDEAMIDEFTKIFERVDDNLLNIAYLSQSTTARLKVTAFTDDTWDDKMGKDVRKRSLGAFKALVRGLLDVDKPEELNDFSFKYKPEMKSAPGLHARLEVYARTYGTFIDTLIEAYGLDEDAKSDDIVDLGVLNQLIERLPMAYAIAKHMVQPLAAPVSATSTQTSDTSTLRYATPNTKRRFENNSVVAGGGLGYANSPGMGFSNQNQPQQSRFQAPIVHQTTTDIFAPVTRQAEPVGFGNMGYNGNTGFSPTPTMGMGSGGLGYMAPPSNFSMPGTRRRW